LPAEIELIFAEKGQRFLHRVFDNSAGLRLKRKTSSVNVRENRRSNTSAAKHKEGKVKTQNLEYNQVNTAQNTKIRRKGKSILREQ